MNNREVWKNVVGYEGYYDVSNLGRVKRLETEHMLTPQEMRGYYKVGLCVYSELKYFYIHRLVAEAFIPNPDNLPCINHKDESRNNNCADNLEWCTHKYNMTYGTIQQRISDTQNKPIIQKTKDGKEVGSFKSALQVEKELGINYSNIRQCVRGNRKSAGGFLWEKGE